MDGAAGFQGWKTRMTSSIPTPIPSSPSDTATQGTSLDSFFSSQGPASQNEGSGAGEGSDFGALLDSSSHQDAAPAAQSTPGSSQAPQAPSTVSAAPAAEAPAQGEEPDTDPASGQGKPVDGRAEAKRDLAEAIAAMLSPLFVQAQPNVPALVPAKGNGSTGSVSSGQGSASGAATGAVPASGADPGPASSGLSQVYGRIVAALSAEMGATGTKAPPVSGRGPAAGDTGVLEGPPTPSSPAVIPGTGAAPLLGTTQGAEKIAAAVGPQAPAGISSNLTPKKNFLTSSKQLVTNGSQAGGISTAKTPATMPIPFSLSRQMADSTGAAAGAPVAPVAQIGSALQQAQAPVPAAPITPTLAPVLAQRAVETVLNVVDAQQVSAAQPGTVKLDFTFGGEALAVHVQMKGGEIHTEFRTNSPELRSALSSEWQAAAGQRSSDGVKLAEPVFSSGNGGSTTADGSQNGQGFAFQQQNSRQQSPATSDTPLLRPSRAGVPAKEGASDAGASSPSVANRTSLHLAAVA